jgi:hypothetical protein
MKNIVWHTYKLKRVALRLSVLTTHTKQNKSRRAKENHLEVMDMFTTLRMVKSTFMCRSKHHIVYINYLQSCLSFTPKQSWKNRMSWWTLCLNYSTWLSKHNIISSNSKPYLITSPPGKNTSFFTKQTHYPSTHCSVHVLLINISLHSSGSTVFIVSWY